jgi:hypothetical protein
VVAVAVTKTAAKNDDSDARDALRLDDADQHVEQLGEADEELRAQERRKLDGQIQDAPQRHVVRLVADVTDDAVHDARAVVNEQVEAQAVQPHLAPEAQERLRRVEEIAREVELLDERSPVRERQAAAGG